MANVRPIIEIKKSLLLVGLIFVYFLCIRVVPSTLFKESLIYKKINKDNLQVEVYIIASVSVSKNCTMGLLLHSLLASALPQCNHYVFQFSDHLIGTLCCKRVWLNGMKHSILYI
jgi:hypothetical protein